MKKIILCIALFLVAISANISFSQVDSDYVRPRYQMTINPGTYVTPTTYEFDVYLRHTNRDSTVFLYGANQYFFWYNTNVVAGGTMTMSIVESELSQALRPVNPTVFQNQLRLAANLPTGPTNTDTVKWQTPGTKVLRLRLTNTVPFNQADTINVRWKNAPGNPFTKVTVFTGVDNTVLTEITNASGHINPPTGIGSDPVSNVIPTEFSISQNYPNPFNPTTKIDFAIPVDGTVNLKIYDITGREMMSLVNEVKTAGFYSVNFNGANLASGMYFYRIDVTGEGDKKFEQTRRMVLIK